MDGLFSSNVGLWEGVYIEALNWTKAHEDVGWLDDPGVLDFGILVFFTLKGRKGGEKGEEGKEGRSEMEVRDAEWSDIKDERRAPKNVVFSSWQYCPSCIITTSRTLDSGKIPWVV